ncbi:MAG: sortase [Anaerolineae bacterium]|nr:sortase [Anaerolineae bacterium]MDW8098415.1 sortase [Anaerolineae bacterium]
MHLQPRPVASRWLELPDRLFRWIGLMVLWGLALLGLGGCSGAHLTVVIGPASRPGPVTDMGVAVQSTPRLRHMTAPSLADLAPQPTPTPTSRPTLRIPAQSAPERIVAPSIQLDAPVVTVGWTTLESNGNWFSQWETASYAAGFHRDSALPGHVGNTVISGHHNIEGKVFEHLVDLEPGDLIILYADGREYRYRVEDRFILKEAGVPIEQRRQNALWIAPTRDERLTLVTCWPPDGNDYRVIVVAKPSE